MKNFISYRLVMVLTLLFGAVSAAIAEDRLYILPVNFEPGEVKNLAFDLENDREIFGFQADITLPDGMEFETENGKPDCTLSERANSSYTLVSNQLSAESIRIGAFSTNHTAITGNSGTLLNIKVKASDSFSGGTVIVKNILLVDGDDNDVELPDISMEIGNAHSNELYIDNFKIEVGETKTLSLILDNETQFTAFQADIYLPVGLSYVAGSQELTERSSGHTLSVKVFDDSHLRFVCMNLNNVPFSENTGSIMTFAVKAQSDVSKKTQIEVQNVICTTETAKEYILPNTACEVDVSNTSELAELAPDAFSYKFDGNTIILKGLIFDSEVKVADITGRMIIFEKVQSEELTLKLPPHSLYFISVGNRVTKLLIP